MHTYDLHVRLNQLESNTDITKLFNLAQQLEYAGLALESSHPLPKKLLKGTIQILQRITISPQSAARLRARVEKHRMQTDLLVIQGRTKPIWLAAAEIPAVDMIMLRDLQDFTTIDSQVARTMTAKNKPVEICLHGLLSFTGPSRSRLMRVMNTAIEQLIRSKCPLILTSGATNLCYLRAPRDLAALSHLANVPETNANEAILQEPLHLVSKVNEGRNHNKRTPGGSWS